MYTSPHLTLPEERIRINFKPLDPSLFARYFFEVFDKLPSLAADLDPTKPVVERGPRFLQLYALLAFHVFIREKVDAAILETHSGGEYDATNVVKKPLVTAVTTLGMDHVEMLGPSIQNIAWHKSGVYKPRAVALSTTQDSGPAKVLEERASALGLRLRFVGEDSRLPQAAVQLKPRVQQTNASLGIAVAEAFLQSATLVKKESLTKEDIEVGIGQWSWLGRFQVIPDGRHVWFLDSAHNEMSVKIAAEWFADSCAELDGPVALAVIFSHISELRDATHLLRSLAAALKEHQLVISHFVFTTNDTSEQARRVQQPSDPTAFCEIWKNAFPKSEIMYEPTIRGAIQRVKNLASSAPNAVRALITGSQHLVGPALQILQAG